MARSVSILLLGVGLAGCGEVPTRQEIPEELPVQFARASDDAVRHGERLARVLGCIGCHGADLTGENWSEPGFGTLWTANLTRVAAREDDAALVRSIATGVNSNGRELWEMPSVLFTQLSRSDMAAVIAYLRSRPQSGPDHPSPVFEAAARREMEAGTYTSSAADVRAEGRSWPPSAPGDHRLARYIVRSTCAECHRMNLGGGQPNPDARPRPDLRMVAAYTIEDFRTLLRTGKAAGNREVGLMSQVARGRYAHLTNAEVDAIYAYLRALGSQS